MIKFKLLKVWLFCWISDKIKIKINIGVQQQEDEITF